MADRVDDLPKLEGGFDAATYSDRLQETRQAPGALGPVQVFDKTKPASIVPFVRYVRDTVYSRVQALIEFTGDHEIRLNGHDSRLNTQAGRISKLEAERLPFGSRSG